MRASPVPYLPTFSRKPSWVNKAGRIDRSACMEIRVTELLPLIESQWKHTGASIGLIASNRITITPQFILELHDTRAPRHLVGDLRTPKSNAMKHQSDLYRQPVLSPHDQRWIAHPTRYDCFYGNPNKGASRTKMLGLVIADQFTNKPWKQEIEVHRVMKSRPPRLTGRPLRHFNADKETQLSRERSFQYDTCPPPPRFQHFAICPGCNQRYLKLFMTLAYEQEIFDAEIAEGWINLMNSVPHFATQLQRNDALRTKHQALIKRYWPLFRERRLLCRKCMGIRYGEVKKKRFAANLIREQL